MKSAWKSNRKVGRKYSVAILVLFGMIFVGCGSGEPSVEERLLKRQRDREIRQATKPKTYDELLADIEHEYKLQNYHQVKDLALELLADHPDEERLLTYAAQAERASGNVLVAAEWLDKIPTDTEHGHAALRLAATWLADVMEYDEAIMRLQKLQEMGAAKRRDLHLLAALLNNAGRRSEAASVLNPLLREGDLNEKELFSLITLGSPFVDSSRPKPDFKDKLAPAALAEARMLREQDALEAQKLANRLFGKFSKSTAIYAFLARVHAELQAWEPLKDLIPFRPGGYEVEPEFWYAIGALFQHHGQHRNAVGCFRQAVMLDPTDRFSFQLMSQSLRVLEENKLSEQMMQRYELLDESSRLIRKIGLAPGTEEQLQRLANILDAMHRPFEAIAWRTVAIRQRGAFTEDLNALEKARIELLDRGGPTGIEIVLADLSEQDWPVPDLDAIDLRAESQAESRTARSTTIHLADVAQPTGLEFQFINRHPAVDQPFLIYHLNGGGIGVFDFDHDGWQDCYFSQAGGSPHDAQGSLPNQLFRNLGGVRFENVSESSDTADQGFGQGVSVADLNQDGFPDLLVANIGVSVWFRNQGDGTFVRQTLNDSADGQGDWTTSIACGDLSGDALPEIVMVNYSNDPDAYRFPCETGGEYCSPQRFRAAADQVLTVTLDGNISSWTKGWAEDQAPGHGFAAVITNIDQKIGNELYVVNDTDSNHYYVSSLGNNDTDDSLTENASLFGLATGVRGNRQGCMGIAAGDFDRNGLIDFHVTNYWDQPSDLYLQQSGGIFQNATMGHGVGSPSVNRVGWGTQAADLDRDGWLDIAVLNGHVVDANDGRTPYKMTPQLFRGSSSRLDPITISDPYWVRPALGRTLAQLDWNRDGKIDLIANHLDLPAALLENQSAIENWIRFELVGGESERDAVGAQVKIDVGEESWTGWLTGGDGFQCNNESVVDFGIGKSDSPVNVEISWPSGMKQRVNELAVNQRYLIIEGQFEAFPR